MDLDPVARVIAAAAVGEQLVDLPERPASFGPTRQTWNRNSIARREL